MAPSIEPLPFTHYNLTASYFLHPVFALSFQRFGFRRVTTRTGLQPVTNVDSATNATSTDASEAREGDAHRPAVPRGRPLRFSRRRATRDSRRPLSFAGYSCTRSVVSTGIAAAAGSNPSNGFLRISWSTCWTVGQRTAHVVSCALAHESARATEATCTRGMTHTRSRRQKPRSCDSAPLAPTKTANPSAAPHRCSSFVNE